MNLIQESFTRLFPNKEFLYKTEIEYNRRLGNFNANVSLNRNKIKINLNLQWKDIDEEIKIGLIQHLLSKIFKNKQSTTNIQLYNNFVRNIPKLTPKTKSNPILKNSFQRMNLQFFDNKLEQPNLTWGTDSRRKLACYNFHSDTITVSTLFQESQEEILDYIMYHEMLHKHHKFTNKNGRSSYHSPQFKKDEAKYPNHKQMEKEINKIVRKINPVKIKRGLFNYFGF
jgi:predicted metal-dependent hydrolase